MKVKSEREVARRVRLFATLWTAAYQAPPSMGFSRQEYWSGCHCLCPARCFHCCYDISSSYKMQLVLARQVRSFTPVDIGLKIVPSALCSLFNTTPYHPHKHKLISSLSSHIVFIIWGPSHDLWPPSSISEEIYFLFSQANISLSIILIEQMTGGWCYSCCCC